MEVANVGGVTVESTASIEVLTIFWGRLQLTARKANKIIYRMKSLIEIANLGEFTGPPNTNKICFKYFSE